MKKTWDLTSAKNTPELNDTLSSVAEALKQAATDQARTAADVAKLGQRVGRIDPSLSYVSAVAGVSLTLPAAPTWTDVAGATVTLPQAGVWLISAVFEFVVTGAGDALLGLYGALNLAGTVQAARATFAGPAGAIATAAQQWIVTANAGAIAKLQGNKAGGTGASTIYAVYTTLVALRIADA